MIYCQNQTKFTVLLTKAASFFGTNVVAILMANGDELLLFRFQNLGVIDFHGESCIILLKLHTTSSQFTKNSPLFTIPNEFSYISIDGNSDLRWISLCLEFWPPPTYPVLTMEINSTNTAKTPVLNSTPPVLWEVHTKLVLILTPVGVSLILLSVKFNTGGCYSNTYQC